LQIIIKPFFSQLNLSIMDYFPNNDATLLLWAQNYKAKIATLGAGLGLTAADITAEQSLCDELIEKITNVQTAKSAAASAVTQKEASIQTAGGALRVNNGRHKKATTYTAAIGEELNIVGTANSIDVNTYKAKISAEKFAGYIRIKFSKLGADGINLYHRKKGETQWGFLARDTKSPYDDHIELTAAGQPEHWEYRAYGVINDDEIGQASDIVEVVFGG
jgi:hypothetical protein